jgi:hypothetical protein
MACCFSKKGRERASTKMMDGRDMCRRSIVRGSRRRQSGGQQDIGGKMLAAD